MSSLFKKAHKTHAFAQPAGVPYPHLNEQGTNGLQVDSDDERLLAQFMAIARMVDDPTERARLLGVAVRVDAAWQKGKMLPLLRAHRTGIEPSGPSNRPATPR
jgi:hypothetical protein